ncbi:M16 family metallopeptidase [Thermorudis peleae]|uniref:M16 family metallopeptidase n=1 Tax=Thermorudis peleae TaxID=1382356 RepID=UPI00056F3A72|nr:pitrilysin family protein [Thermorudis peleae]
MQLQLQAHTSQLANGLTVIVQPLRRVPVVSCWIWYRVGSRNELPGKTGISHWVEHMLFKGTPRFPPGSIFREVQRWGGMLNGFTWIDYTAYFATVPVPALDLPLTVEADRMQHAVFDPAEVERERTVILSEREGNENQPATALREEVVAAAFRAHPYGHPVIGYREDLLALTRDDLYQHYRTYYTPGNATLVLVGDVDPADVLERVAQRFGDIPSGTPPPPLRVREPEQLGERRVRVRRPAPAPILLLAWRAPEATHPDTPAMAMLDLVLSGAAPLGFSGGGGMGRSSRLYRALVASGLCSQAGSSVALSIDPFLFTVSATLTPAAELARVEEIVWNELEKLRQEPVSAAELERAQRQLESQFAQAAEQTTTMAYFRGMLATVAPGWTPEQWRDALLRVTPEDIQRVADTHLRPERCTAGWLEPADRPAPYHNGASPSSSMEVGGPVPAQWYTGGTSPSVVLPAAHLSLTSQSLSNGLTVVNHYDPQSELVVLALRLPAGAARDGEQPGLAHLTGQLLARGTAQWDEAALNERLDQLGAALSVGVGRDAVDIVASGLRRDAAALVELLAAVVRTPTFPEDQLERVRTQVLTQLRLAEQNTRAQADALLRASVYPPGHPYHHRVIGTAETLRQLDREALVAFHERMYRPAGGILAVAGGLSAATALQLIERHFGDWQGTVTPLSIPPVTPPVEMLRRHEYLPGKSQADLAIGLPVIPRSHPDFEPLRLANAVLGRLGMMGRIGQRVREQLGLAYYASSSLDAALGPGLWHAAAGVNPANVEQALEAILDEVSRLRAEPPSSTELDDVRTSLVGGALLALETSGAIAGLALDLMFYGLGLDYLERLPEMLAAFTPEDVRAVAERYLDPTRMAIVVVGPPDSETNPPNPPVA